MFRLSTLFAKLSLALLMLACSTAQADDRNDLPERLKVFEKHCSVEDAETWFALLIEHMGPSDRVFGSTARILEWNVAGGFLYFDRVYGPSFYDPVTKKGASLRCTRTLVGEKILGSYEMTGLPDERGSHFWLGNLKFDQDGRYSFKPAGYSCSKVPTTERNFFIDHPQGRFTLEYMSGISGESVLESLGDDVRVARLHFTSDDSKARSSYVIKNSTNTKSFVFSADDALVFRMTTSWRRTLKRKP